MDIYGYLWIFDIHAHFTKKWPIMYTLMWWLQSSRFPTSHAIPNSKQLLGEVAHVAIVPGHGSGAGELRDLQDLLMNAAIHLLLAHVRHVPSAGGEAWDPKEIPKLVSHRIHGAAIYGDMDPINIPPLC